MDLLFDEDTAFWPALAQVSQKAKCPIVLTATSAPDELNNFKMKHIALERPSSTECSVQLAEVAKSEGMRFSKNLDVGETSRRLNLIAEVCQCDLRKILNEMQLFHFAKSKQSSSSAKIDMDNLGFTQLWAMFTYFSSIGQALSSLMSMAKSII